MLTGTLKGEVYAVSMELGFSDVLVPEMLRLRGDLSAGTSRKEDMEHHEETHIPNISLSCKITGFPPPPHKKSVCFKGTLHSISTSFLPLSLWHLNH